MNASNEKGTAFRGAIANLLRARYGATAVTEEVEIDGGKAADIVFVASDLPGIKTPIAVECKAWSKPLQAADLRSIRSDYAPAYDKGEIKHLYIISPIDINATPRNSIKSTHWITFLTFSQFQASIIDFSSYLNDLLRLFSANGLDKYYVPARIQGEDHLHTKIIEPWLKDSTAKPLAIVAGYGMGKTSYSKYLAALLATKAIEDGTAPIPILIPLGDLVQQQNIRSLVSYLFADVYCIPGYSFHIFDALNKNGRFIIIFDAFDEMKHAMRRRDIIHNLEDIQSLIYPSTKALLMGRPDPFVSDEEISHLRGRDIIFGRDLRSPRLAAFDLILLDYFTDDDYKLFITNYIDYLRSVTGSKPSSKGNTKGVPPKILPELVEAEKFYELGRRPLQAKMIAELLLEPDSRPTSAIFALYEHFIRYVLRRETEKLARAQIEEEARFRFVRSVAWWLWTRRDEPYFYFADLPAKLLAPLSEKPGTSRDGLARELLVGSLLDRRLTTVMTAKSEDYFYFAHRSYWEFLVVSYLVNEQLSDAELRLISRCFTPQLGDFLNSVTSGEQLNRLYRRVAHTDVFVSLEIFLACARSGAVSVRYETRDTLEMTQGEALMFGLMLRNHGEERTYRSWE